MKESKPSDEVFNTIDFHAAGADVEVTFLDGFGDLRQTDPESAEGVGIDIDLVFFLEATDRGDLGYTIDCLKGVADVIVLNAAELVGGPAAGWSADGIEPFEGVPEDLAKSGGVRTEAG